MLRVIVGRLSY